MSRHIQCSTDQNSGYGESKGKEQRQVFIQYKRPASGERNSSLHTRATPPPHISIPGFSIPRGRVSIGDVNRREFGDDNHRTFYGEELRLEERKIHIKERMARLQRMEDKIILMEDEKLCKLEEIQDKKRQFLEEEEKRPKKMKKLIERRHDVSASSASREVRRIRSQNTGTNISKHKLSDIKSTRSFHGSRHKLSPRCSFREMNRMVKRRSRSFSESPSPRRPSNNINKRGHAHNTSKNTRNPTHPSSPRRHNELLCESCPEPGLHLPGPCPGLSLVCHNCQKRGHIKGAPLCRRFVKTSMKSRLGSRRLPPVHERLGLKAIPSNNNNFNNRTETKKIIKSQVQKVNHVKLEEYIEEDRQQFIIMEQKLKQKLIEKEKNKSKDRKFL